MEQSPFSESDERQLQERGLSVEEASRQLELFRRPPQFIRLERACTLGDGIERIAEEAKPQLRALHAEASRSGRLTKFVPASGAASRMFRHLLYFQQGRGRELSWSEIERRAGDGQPREATLVEFLREVGRFAFRDDLHRVLFRRSEDLAGLARVGAFQPVLDALLGADGLDYDARPKGLIKFHACDDGGRTAFEEHLEEAAAYVRDGDGRCRLHLTVSPEHRRGFEELFARVGQDAGSRHDAHFEIGYSAQKPSTDTLAVDASGRPLRGTDGRLRFRPGGHGALVENLNDLGGDLVFVKNIDNVQPDRLREATIEWKRLLGGHLVGLEREASRHLRRLREPAPSQAVVEQAEEFVRRRFHVELDGRREPPSYQARRACLISRLNRPLRVCGVVPNTGEPGGGPFWVLRGDATPSLQIVEAAQIDPADPEQQRLFGSSTHFNPVDLVCSVRDADGAPFDLRAFVDQDAAIVTEKSEAGRELLALERPGLWNGGMAGWNTVFVEVPIETFSPVKTVLDLLRPEHRG